MRNNLAKHIFEPQVDGSLRMGYLAIVIVQCTLLNSLTEYALLATFVSEEMNTRYCEWTKITSLSLLI